MFTIEQINDLHATLGSARTFQENVRALKALGVERYDSYLADGHSEYFGQGGHTVVSPPAHEVFPVAETGQRETFLGHLRRHEQRQTTYLEMSQGPGAERDKEVDCGHGQDDYDVLRQRCHTLALPEESRWAPAASGLLTSSGRHGGRHPSLHAHAARLLPPQPAAGHLGTYTDSRRCCTESR